MMSMLTRKEMCERGSFGRPGCPEWPNWQKRTVPISASLDQTRQEIVG